MYLIVGGDSTIGRALSNYWTKINIPHCTSTRRREQVNQTRPYVDLASKDWTDLKRGRYDAVVFCAAVTKLVECEDHPETTAKINVEATIALANFMGLRGSHLLLLSTNQVFDGSMPIRKVSDQVCPANEYGRQKVEAERLILQTPRSAVLRLTKVVHPDMLLLKQWEMRLKAGQPIEAFVDISIAPISLGDVVKRVDKLIRNRKIGIYHLSGKSEISYYSFARNYFRTIANAETLIKKLYSGSSQATLVSGNRYTMLS